MATDGGREARSLVIQIPGYFIQRTIGTGGMATVYLAVQASLEREVALKVMNPSLAADPNFSRRFLQEARTLASLSHPNIVAVYDVGATDGQLNYFSMQLLPRGDFAHRIREGIGEAEIARVLRGVGAALGFAHGRGFVHRDVSPANVLFDANDHPILTDFGIARAVARSSRLTTGGMSVGTSHYMSPEQARGGDVDARSDIYSLGAVTVEALTGKPPYDGEDGFAIAYAHVFEPVPQLPPALAHWQPLVERALAKDPRERFADVAAFLEALDEVAGKAPISLTGRLPAVASTIALPTSRGGSGERAAVPADAPAPQPAPDRAAATRVTPRPAAAGAEATASGARRWLPWAGIGAGVVLLLAAVALWVLRDDGRAPVPARPAASTPGTGTAAATKPARAVADAQPGAADALVQAGGDDAPTPALDATATDDPEALRVALATTVVDPINLLFALGQADLAATRLAQPPGRNALERFTQALALAEHFEAPRDVEKAKAGIVATAAGYVDLGEKALAEGRQAEFLDYLRRADQIAAGLPEGAETRKRVATRLGGLRDAALAEGDAAARAWDKAAAEAAYQRALSYDPASKAAQRGLAGAARIGSVGFVFRDPRKGGGDGPEMVIASVGGKRLAVARDETTLAGFREYWTAEGARARGGERPACRDRESFFRSSRKNSFESPGFSQAANHPVVCVSWDDASDYARWLSAATGKRYRLPSAAEWTALAPRASEPCKANLADASYNAKYRERAAFDCDDGNAETAPVRRFDASAAGVYDIAGNVREWVSDCAQGCKQHLALGSSWASPGDESDPQQREGFGADVASNTVGFRVVREVD